MPKIKNHPVRIKYTKILTDCLNLDINPSPPTPGLKERPFENLLCNGRFITLYMRLNPCEKKILKRLSRMQEIEEIACGLQLPLATAKSVRKNMDRKVALTSSKEYRRFLYWILVFVS